MHILVTPRLTLRPPLEVDTDRVLAILGDRRVAWNLSRVPHPFTREDARDWIRRAGDRDNPVQFTIHRHTMIGAARVRIAKDGPSLGYWLATECQGRGYAVEAAVAVLAHAFRLHGFTTVHAGAAVDNAPSHGVLKRLGFKETHRETCPIASRGQTVVRVRFQLTRERFEQLHGARAMAA